MIPVRNILLLLILCSCTSSAQIPVHKEWDYRYGGDAYEFPSTLLRTLDKGYLLCGGSLSNTSFDKSENCRTGLDYWIVKSDSLGVKQWDKTFGGSETDFVTAAITLQDSGFILGGYSVSQISGDKTQPCIGNPIPADDYWIVRIDRNGNKLWDRTFGGDKKDRLNSLLLLPDNTILLGGYTFSDSTGDMSHCKYGDNDFWLIKTDLNGNKIWDKNYGGSFDDRMFTMTLTPDLNVILAGYSNSDAGGTKSQNSCNSSYDYWMLKIDQDGNRIWDKTLGGTSKDYFSCMTIMPSGKMILCGVSFPGQGCDKSFPNYGTLGYTDYWVVCTDENGNKLWDRVYGGDRNEDELNNVAVIDDDILITGTSYSFMTGDKSEDNVLSTEQPWLIAIDSLGNKRWDKTIHNPTHTEFTYGFQSDENCYTILCNAGAAGGFVSQTRNSGDDYWIAKFCAAPPVVTSHFTASTNALCQNTCIDFANLSENATTYQWLFPGGWPATDTAYSPQNICYFNHGVFDVTLIASDSTHSDTLTMNNYLTVFPMVNFSPLVQSGDTLYSVPGFVNYIWYYDTTVIAGENNYFLHATMPGDYSVMVTDSNGCTALATLLQVATTMEEIDSAPEYTTNWLKGNLYFSFRDNSSTSVHIVLINSLGKIIYNRKHFLNNGDNAVSLPVDHLASGTYFIKLNTSKSAKVIKLFLE